MTQRERERRPDEPQTEAGRRLAELPLVDGDDAPLDLSADIRAIEDEARSGGASDLADRLLSRGVRLPGEGLGELRALSDAATPGPWHMAIEHESGDYGSILSSWVAGVATPDGTLVCDFSDDRGLDITADAKLIAAAVNDLRTRLRALPGEDETPRPSEDDLVEPPDPSVWQNAKRRVRAGEGEEPRP